jgi:hypothetical protein
MQCNNPFSCAAASCHRDARDGDLHASAGMVIPFHSGYHKPGMCMWRCCLDVTVAIAIRATVKGPDRCEWSRLESWERARVATPLQHRLYNLNRLWKLSSTTAVTQNHQPYQSTGLQVSTCKTNNHSHPASYAYDNRHHGLIRQELHPRPSHGLPPHRHHRRRHHGWQRGGRPRRTY